MDPHLAVDVPANLARNLRALAPRDRLLAERILLPVGGDHVRIEPDGSGLYRLHRTFVPFRVPSEELERSVAAVGDEGGVLLFGIGLGEQLEHLLESRPEVSVVAWDRDPWLLRQTLIAHDFSEVIREGRLELKLGVDLIDLIDRPPALQLVQHPFLGDVYALERHLLENGIGERRVALAVGTLFVEDMVESLREAGYSVFPIDVKGWSFEELVHAVDRLDPRFVARIDYTSNLAEFCHRVGRELLVWEIDPSTDTVQPCSTASDHAHIFTYRRRDVELYRRAGFEHVEYLPLAANTYRRTPLRLTDAERDRYAVPVSFVGSSMVAMASELLARLRERYSAWHLDGQAALVEFDRTTTELLLQQRQDGSRWMLPDLIQERYGEFLAHARAERDSEDPVILLGETAAAERRLSWVRQLAPFGVEVWGDSHWKPLEAYGVRYRGQAAHGDELTRIYNATDINVDIGRLYQTDIVTMRVFDVLACGGFLIAESSDALEELFEVGVELETYSTIEELREKIVHYLAHPARARAIAERGLLAVRERHAFRDRVTHMLTTLGDNRPAHPTGDAGLRVRARA